MSRPSEFTAQLGDVICGRLADGESLRAICRDDDMPCNASVYNWLRTFPQFLEQYTRAKEDSADAMQDDILHISDGEGDVQRDRLRVEARKWIASKLKPKKYGDKIVTTHKGDPTAPVPFQLIASDIPSNAKTD